MGNCIDVLSYSSAERSKVLIHNGGEKEFKSSTRVQKITSGRYGGYMLVHSALPYVPLPPDTRLEPGEVYHLMPSLGQPCRLEVSSKLAGQETCASRKVKIVVTRQQLELLLRNSKQFRSKGIAVRFSESFKEGERKWRPSLVTIPEEDYYLYLLSGFSSGGRRQRHDYASNQSLKKGIKVSCFETAARLEF
ncbi:hypothetical protein Peur_043951 [Populus x canadensis]